MGSSSRIFFASHCDLSGPIAFLSAICLSFLAATEIAAQSSGDLVFGRPSIVYSQFDDQAFLQYMHRNGNPADLDEFCRDRLHHCTGVERAWNFEGSLGLSLVVGTDTFGKFLSFVVPQVQPTVVPPIYLSPDGFRFEIVEMSPATNECAETASDRIFKLWSDAEGVVLRLSSQVGSCENGIVDARLEDGLVIGEVAEIAETRLRIYLLSLVKNND